MAPEGQKPSPWLWLTKLSREMYSQPIVHKALSWGTIRKSACILAEITIRKSQVISLDLRFHHSHSGRDLLSSSLTSYNALDIR
jgi:hypothetical protein